ncbi:hypothetical protein WKR88_29060 [Trinickia caryophylli]|uniref:Uncharacterized protein n=1 Tax=Trinickia caryophylli TaxID=28094 RepID=A0A1X7HC69_TRICW|nr:hypothetical protein [Trinickia caryophylli]PMS13671.1 hypothetical protein C0Z17_01900 [Trinickia caryophylli]TRX14164.1 hypothetical protein FNF07_22890 [Trinickia caryophylli]WQE13988.1 hypothetical protein U0034_25100 [Trinickia caryophylli]SMF83213.1 hypothetical protein SAMN06295900_1302 [Trinickia caryophylli]GLU33531.1 hypothetical protein Busp01_33730 [Trinickia caryophylli]
MALDFNSLPPEEPVPDKPPSPFLWAVVFLVLTLAGVFVVLMLWPAGEPTRTPWFWVCVTVFPTGMAVLVVTRPFSAYEGRRLDALAWNAACKQYAEQLFARESIPVSILGFAIRVTENDDENRSGDIANGTLKLDAIASGHEQNESISARWLQPIDASLAADDPERQELVLEWLYDRLLTDLTASIASLSAELPLCVLLDISGYAGNVDALELWRTRWNSHKLRAAQARRAQEPLDLMTIDAWLDDQHGPLHGQAMLLVSITLSKVIDETPLDGSAEAGVGLLFTSALLATQFGLPSLAALHRPLRSDNENLDHALTRALQWGSVEPGAVESLWMTGFDGLSVGPLHSSFTHVNQGKKRSEPLPEFDLDRAVGHAGLTSGWLAVACAADRAMQSSTPQLVAQRLADRTLVATVTTTDNESKSRRSSA